MGNPRSFAVLLGAWLGCVAFFGSSSCVTASAQSAFERYEVIPASWLESAGTPVVPVPPPTDVYSAGYVFPSLRPGSSPVPCAAAEGPFECSQNFPSFFGPHSHLAGTYIYKWTAASGDEIQLTVTRSDAIGTIAIAPASLSALMRLDWAGFTQVLSNFRRALCRKNAIIGLNCTHTFVALDADLSQFWSAVAYERAHFADFAARNLNGATKDDFDVSYKGAATTATMRVTPLHLGQVLNIIWGATALYPTQPRALSSGYSRPSMGGATQLRLVYADGVALFPRDTWRTSPVDESVEQKTVDSSDHTKATSVPFPSLWKPLMNFTPAVPAQPATATTPAIAATPPHPPVLLPIFGMLDLRDARLLHAFDLKTPNPFLYLLSPETYIKADAANVDADGLAEFASDARIVTQGQTENQNIDPQVQLTRRFLLIACDRPDDASHNCVNREFKSLMDQAAAASQVPNVPTPGYPVSTIGVFGNQTYLEARDHISLDGKPSEDTYLTGETWGAVVAAWTSSENGDATFGATPLLEVRRTQSRLGLPTLRMRVDFYTTSLDVLDAAQVMEGDEFYGHPHL